MGRKQIKNLEVKARYFVEQGNMDISDSNYSQALECFENALSIYIELDDANGMATALLRISNINCELGDTGVVARTHQRVEEILPLLSLEQQLNYRAELASLCLYLGDYEAAINHYSSILQVYVEQGNSLNQGACLDNIGLLYRMLGDFNKSQEHHNLALRMAKSIEHPKLEANCLSNLGVLLYYMGDYHSALSNYDQSLSILDNMGIRHQVISTLINKAIVCNALDMPDRTQEIFHTALSIAQKVGDRRSEAYINGYMIEIEIAHGTQKVSIDKLKDASNILEKCWRCVSGTFRGSIALIMAEHGQFETAIELIERSENDVRLEQFEYARFLCKKAMIYHMNGQHAYANATLLEAEHLSTNFNSGTHSILGLFLQRGRTLLNDDRG